MPRAVRAGAEIACAALALICGRCALSCGDRELAGYAAALVAGLAVGPIIRTLACADRHVAPPPAPTPAAAAGAA
jgi:hypothetical protein